MELFKQQTLVALFFGLFMSSCSTFEHEGASESKTTSYLPKTFTSENLITTHIGMTSDEVIKRYGEPKDISQTVCGSEEVGGTWTCTTWKYGNPPYDNASFTFGEEGGALVINNFDIDRVESDLPKTFSTQNIMKVKQGMGRIEILQTFGYPRNVSQSICGSATKSPWVCTTWEYGNPPYANARFTFSLGEDSMLLNDFMVDRD